MKASIVLGLGWGDEGKGLVTDHLCAQDPNSFVVRFSGGQQCGHTVVIDGQRHVHSNFGSGTLRGHPSYISEYCSFYMNTLVNEYGVLVNKGVKPVLHVHPLAIMTTPYDVAYGRLRERQLNHGSCGLGIGATMMRHNSSPYKIFAIDLTMPEVLKLKLSAIVKYYHTSVDTEFSMNQWFGEVQPEYDDFVMACQVYHRYFTISDYDILRYASGLIFEGSQGILLDKDHGIFPNVTYASTTSKNAIALCRKLNVFPNMYYVIRCYQTRHGAGWMSNHERIKLINNEEETCVFNEWQKEFRRGELDYDLLNYALNIDKCYSEASRRSVRIVVTCMDQRPDFKFNEDKIKAVRALFYYSYSPDQKTITQKQHDGGRVSVVS